MNSVNVDDYGYLSLNDIELIEDDKLREEILELYNKEIDALKQDSFKKLFISNDKSIAEIYYDIDQYLDSLRSEYLFDNDIVKFYPSIREAKASKEITCHFSGARISKGSKYCFYKPFLQNITTGKRYVLASPIKVELGYRDMLPSTLQEFELFIQKLDSAEMGYNRNAGLDYYSISCNLDSWSLRELKRKQKKKVLKQEES